MFLGCKSFYSAIYIFGSITHFCVFWRGAARVGGAEDPRLSPRRYCLLFHISYADKRKRLFWICQDGFRLSGWGFKTHKLKKIAPRWFRTWSMTVAQIHYTHVNHMTFDAWKPINPFYVCMCQNLSGWHWHVSVSLTNPDMSWQIWSPMLITSKHFSTLSP